MTADLNMDGEVGIADYSIFINNFGKKEESKAEIHYVTQSGGGDGSTPERPWSVAQFNMSANWDAVAGSDNGKIGPGDIVYVSGTITTNLIPAKSGTADKKIIIDGWRNGTCDPKKASCAESAYFSYVGLRIDVSNIRVQDMRFGKQSRAFVSGENSAGYLQGIEIRNSQFAESDPPRSTILFYKNHDSVVDNNLINNKVGKWPDGIKPGQNIDFLGGKRNVITNNKLIGGKTCIIYKYSRSSNGGGYESLAENNVISGNYCEGFLEEGISFDVIGNAPDQVATLEFDRIASVGNNNVMLENSGGEWKLTGNPSYIGYDMVFMSGSMNGQTRRITGQSAANFTLAEPISGVKSGDQIVIGASFKNNLISKNTINNTKGFRPACILLFGMSFYNTIRENYITNGSISIRSLDDISRPYDSVTGECGRAPCGHNMIYNNTVSEDINVWYRDVDVILPEQNCATSRPSYVSYGNSIVNNTIPGRLYLTKQHCHISGNNYGTIYESSVTYSSSPFPNTPAP